MPPLRPRFLGSGDEQLHIRIRADDRADVAPVQHRARLVRRGFDGEAALKGEQRGAHAGMARHTARRRLGGAAAVLAEILVRSISATLNPVATRSAKAPSAGSPPASSALAATAR